MCYKRISYATTLRKPSCWKSGHVNKSCGRRLSEGETLASTVAIWKKELTVLCGVGFNFTDIFELGLIGYVTICQIEKCKSQLSKENNMNKDVITLKGLG